MTDPKPEPVFSMPVTEVIAYLTEIATYNQMIAERITVQIEALGEAVDASLEANSLIADAPKDVD